MQTHTIRDPHNKRLNKKKRPYRGDTISFLENKRISCYLIPASTKSSFTCSYVIRPIAKSNLTG